MVSIPSELENQTRGAVRGAVQGSASNEKIRFQSFFMLMTFQPCLFASAISESERVPTVDSGP
jgi:hypothetical protein